MIIERPLEAIVMIVAVGTALRLTGVRWIDQGRDAVVASLRGRRFPVAATLLTVALIIGALVELAWPGSWAALRDETGSPGWWRTFTAPFIQHNGLLGTLYNIVTAALVLALAGWFWGDLVTGAVWLLGAWAPVGAVAGWVGYHVSASDAVAYSSGSSGATYFTAGTLCTAMLVFGGGRNRLIGLAAPAIALVMWLVTNDGHGVVVAEGAVLGLVLAAARVALGRRPVVGRPA